MKKLIVIFILLAGLTAVPAVFVSCSSKKAEQNVEYYTCPMHPQIRRDAPGTCPICGMDLVPVFKTTPSGEGEEGHDHSVKTGDGMTSGSISIDPARLQNIGVTTEKTEEKDVMRKILAYGRVAYDPELWVAQHEYIEALKLNDFSLIGAAESKLKLFGLSEKWIELIRKEKKADSGLYLPTTGKGTYFEAFIHQSDVAVLKEGMNVEILDEQGRNVQSGTIEAIGTVVDETTRLIRVLVRSETESSFQSNTFVQLLIDIPLGRHLAVPKKAILFNGNHNMVYKVAGVGKFLPITVELGEIGDDFVAVKSGLNEGDQVVTNGQFLIDSETQLKMGDVHSGHQH